MNKRIAVAFLSIALSGAAHAAPLTFERFDGDSVFTTRCGGTACEKAVAEGRIGNAPNASGTFEFALGVPNTLKTDFINAGGGDAQYGWTSPVDFTLAYDAFAKSLTFGIPGATPASLVAGSLDLSGVGSIYIRAAGRTNSDSSVSLASLTGLTFNGTLVDGGTLTGDATRRYLVIAGFDPAANWTLTGTAALGSGNQAAPSFQIKMTDLDVAPIPLPAAAWLLLSGIGGLAGLSRLRRKAA